MESKYKERAEELLISREYEYSKLTPREKERVLYDLIGHGINTDDVIEAMCELAEEVENTLLNMSTKLLQAKYPGCYFTKEQVEELLQKQRELCSEKVKFVYKTDASFVIDKDSILNAKLKID